MSIGRALETGSGRLEFRLVIEGLDTEFVTHKAMERAAVPASSTTARKVGLRRGGINISEHVDIQAGKLSVGSMTLSIVDVGTFASAQFARFPTKTVYLMQDVTAIATIIYVSNHAGYAVNDVMHINTEAMRITAFGGEDPQQVTVSRAVYSTIAQKHWTENGKNLRQPEVTERPVSLEGRRAYIYAYADADIPLTGGVTNGTQIYIGIVTGDPRLNQNLTEWEITIGSIASMLDQGVGYEDLEPTTLRGIYHPWNSPFGLYVQELNTASNYGYSSLTDGTDFPIVMTKFWETQQDFASDLNGELGVEDNTFVSGGVLSCSAIDDDTIQIVYRTGTTPKYCVVYLPTPRTDGYYTMDGGTFGDVASGGGWYDADGVRKSTLASSSTYHAFIRTLTPRSTAFKVGFIPPDPNAYDISQTGTYPETRAYLNGAMPVSIVSATAVIVRSYFDLETPVERVLTPTANDSALRYIEFSRDDLGRVGAYIGGASRYTFAHVTTPTTASNVAEYLDLIVDNSFNYCNIGAMPFLTTTDYEQVLSERHLNPSIQNRAWADPRQYVFGKIKKLGQILAEEMKMIGCFPCLGLTGKLRFRKMEIPSSSSTPAFVITSANTTWNVVPTWERSSQGMLNTVAYQGEYDSTQDKALGREVVVRDVTGFGQTRIAKGISIKPFSKASTEPGYEDITTIASEFFGMFGYPYVIVTLGIPLTLLQKALVGTIGSFVSGVLPDELDGTRGYTAAKRGLVVGRDWNLATGFGSVTMYVPIMRVAGYTPSVRITARTDNGSNNWTLTVSDAQWDALASTYYADDATLATYYPVGTRISVYEWDDSAPTQLAGVVTALNSTTSISVTFDATWTPGVISTTNAWNLGYDGAEAVALTSAQRGYAFIAGPDTAIDFVVNEPAKVFSA